MVFTQNSLLDVFSNKEPLKGPGHSPHALGHLRAGHASSNCWFIITRSYLGTKLQYCASESGSKCLTLIKLSCALCRWHKTLEDAWPVAGFLFSKTLGFPDTRCLIGSLPARWGRAPVCCLPALRATLLLGCCCLPSLSLPTRITQLYDIGSTYC